MTLNITTQLKCTSRITFHIFQVYMNPVLTKYHRLIILPRNMHYSRVQTDGKAAAPLTF